MSADKTCEDGYTFEKFILYLYLCAAYADYKIDDEEVYMIKEKMSRFNLIKEEDFDKNWHAVVQDFKSHNDIESIQHINGCSNQLGLDYAARQKIYNDFQEIIMADGHEEDSERVNLFKFKKIMGL